MGITVPTPIQKLAIGPVLAGKDIIAKAETGTGKTLAFGAPMMSKIDPSRASVLGLVLCPTRELAEQVCAVLQALGKPRGIRVALIVGGEPLGPQVKALQAGAQVVVGTPGRVLDLYGQRFLSFPWTEYAVLDEADRMLEIGFIDDVRKILSYAPEERQTLLFSATFPPELLKLAREYTRDPVEVATAAGVKTVDSIEQRWMRVTDDDHSLALIRLIEQSEPDDVFLVFCDRREDVDRLMRRLERMPFSIKALHGGYDQEARFRVMGAFRTGEVKALVATDVASRGLDVVHVTHVVNYGPPRDVTDYTHRIGRTGRAGRAGVAITLVTPHGMKRWSFVLKQATWKIQEVDAPGPSRRRAADAAPPRQPRRLPDTKPAPEPAPESPRDDRPQTPGTSRGRRRPGRYR
jgi:ATP-dependent RNA helicase DeaD